jgi:hypothetical protein
MVALRSRRLEALLGSRLDDLVYQDILGFVASQAPEAFDLDYKSALYGGSDRDKRDLATDVAALANTAGGLLMLGLQEDDQARAAATPGVDISDEQRSRIERVIASGIVPLPSFDLIAVENPDSPGNGVLIIAIPRSPLAPHAVLVNEGFRYPRRNGSNTRYLSEPEVADAYRTRFAGGIRQKDRADRAEEEATARLDHRDTLWLVVSLVPDLPGEFMINRNTQLAFQRDVIHTSPAVIPHSYTWQRTSVGRRRLLVDGNRSPDPLPQSISSELHEDGTGVFAIVIAEPRANDGPHAAFEPPMFPVDDEELVSSLISALRFLGVHARDRAAAGGDALVRAFIYPLRGNDRQAFLSHSRGHRGVPQQIGTHVLSGHQPPAERVIPLDSIATDGVDLIAAACLIATELFQMFGWPEVGQLTREGAIRRLYWSRHWQPPLLAWAHEHGIRVLDETLPD